MKITSHILDAPYVFAREKRRKPFHQEVVTQRMRGAICHNGCGRYYVGETLSSGDECPDCLQPPKPWNVGAEVELVDVAVRMAFGNLIDANAVRTASGFVAKKKLALRVDESRGLVLIPGEK